MVELHTGLRNMLKDGLRKPAKLPRSVNEIFLKAMLHLELAVGD